MPTSLTLCFFPFNAPATTEIYTLSLHDALPIYILGDRELRAIIDANTTLDRLRSSLTRYVAGFLDRKSTRLNSSHQIISYAVFCLKKKKHEDDDRNERTEDHVI